MRCSSESHTEWPVCPGEWEGWVLRSARRTAPAAYWASWADALPMVEGYLPQVAQVVTAQLEEVDEAVGCLGELQRATRVLDFGGFVSRMALRAGCRQPPSPTFEFGEWQHGWQYHSSSSLEFHFLGTVVLAQSSAADQAHLRSHSGPAAGEVLCGAPTGPEFALQPSQFRTIVLERLRLPLEVTEAFCLCGSRLDSLGRHRAACPQSGRLRERAAGPERTLARICREGGAVVRNNVKLRNVDIIVPATDEREIEVVASGLPLRHGAQLAIDITLRSALTASGGASPDAARVNGPLWTERGATKKPSVRNWRCSLSLGGRCHWDWWQME